MARLVPGAKEEILESLRWLKLDWDEGPEVGGEYGPYTQSQRLSLYHEAAESLVQGGHAYRCYCSPQRLEQMRAEQTKRKEPPRYDRRCLVLDRAEAESLKIAGTPSVVRFKMPLSGETAFSDLIRGTVTFDNSTLDDFVILKSDGYPTYHLASIVDDHAMRISHVLRAEEWLSSTPRHVLLYRAMGWEPPVFAHLPMILGPDRSKLSKRHGATALLEYKDNGFLSETMVNFLALLGWALDDKTELFTREDLVRQFTLERISKTPAIFDRAKLEWMNGVYIRRLEPPQFASLAMPFLEKGLPSQTPRPLSLDYVTRVAPLIQERARTLAECPQLAEFFFVEDLQYDTATLLPKDTAPQDALRMLKASVDQLGPLEPFDGERIEPCLRSLAEALGVKTGALFGLLRTATTGRTAAPPLFQTMAVLGKERSLRRIRQAMEKLGKAGHGL